MFRFLTPASTEAGAKAFTGKFPEETVANSAAKSFTYGPNLLVDFARKQYEFRNDSHVNIPRRLQALCQDYDHKQLQNNEEIPRILIDLIGLEEGKYIRRAPRREPKIENQLVDNKLITEIRKSGDIQIQI